MSNSSSFRFGLPTCRMCAQANPPPRMNPSGAVRGHPASTCKRRAPNRSVNNLPTIVAWPMRNRCSPNCSICKLAPLRLPSAASSLKVVINQSTAVRRTRSLADRNATYSAMSCRPMARARRSASASALVHCCSNSLKHLPHRCCRALATGLLAP
ncbi:MAG: hypothetical protein QOD75_2268 [Blastocatellia bacterium]|nr:hypothetical protein [Blastocatellia bacterium]